MLPVTYLLPIRSHAPPPAELTEYLRRVSSWCPLVVVDGSSDEVFEAAHREWGTLGVHVRPGPDVQCRNGKVLNVLTGLTLISTEYVVIADDDIRYDEAVLSELLAALVEADLVMPQNHFMPLPWHARWDTARTLLNRVTGGDFAGTLGVRTAVLTRTGGYDGDVLFENLELMRTVAAAGGTVRRAPDLFVRRLPPTTRHFFGQRVRQAYDELARPLRFVGWLAVLPVAAGMLQSGRGRVLCLAAPIAVAEAGRRRAGGRQYFSGWSSLLAPAWVAERAVCIWLALLLRLRGGVPYAGARLRCAAHSTRSLRRRVLLAPVGAERAVGPMSDAYRPSHQVALNLV